MTVRKPYTHRVVSNSRRTQDLTFCYRHMTRDELTLLDTIEDGEFSDGNLSDEGAFLVRDAFTSESHIFWQNSTFHIT